MAQIRKPRKIGNTYPIWVKMVFLDIEFIRPFIDTKTSKRKTYLLRNRIFPTSTHNGRFWPKCKLPIFMAQIRKPLKIANTYRILVKMVSLKTEFIPLYINIKSSKKESAYLLRSRIFRTSTQNGWFFWSKCKWRIASILAKMADFHGSTSQASKNRKY